MVYFWLKILHILTATLLLLSMAYSYRLWKYAPESAQSVQRIQTQTWLVILPLTIMQLATGFSIISIQHYDMSESWISGSVIGFITVIAAWFSFVILQNRRLQSVMLHVCGLAILVMIFLMANKT